MKTQYEIGKGRFRPPPLLVVKEQVQSGAELIEGNEVAILFSQIIGPRDNVEAENAFHFVADLTFQPIIFKEAPAIGNGLVEVLVLADDAEFGFVEVAVGSLDKKLFNSRHALRYHLFHLLFGLRYGLYKHGQHVQKTTICLH